MIRCHHKHIIFIFSEQGSGKQSLRGEWCKNCGSIKLKNSRGNLSKWVFPQRKYTTIERR